MEVTTMDPNSFFNALFAIATITQASITSTYRTTEHNTRVGGHPQSKHLVGLAGDLIPINKTKEPLLKLLVQNYDLKLVIEKDHYHIQTK